MLVFLLCYLIFLFLEPIKISQNFKKKKKKKEEEEEERKSIRNSNSQSEGKRSLTEDL